MSNVTPTSTSTNGDLSFDTAHAYIREGNRQAKNSKSILNFVLPIPLLWDYQLHIIK